METPSMASRVLASWLLILAPTVAMGGPQYSDIVGAWVCEPYEMTGPDFVVSGIDRPTYSSDGKFTELTSGMYTMTDGTKVQFETQHEGSWKLTGDIIEVQLTSGKFLWSDNPILPVAAGQASVDAQMQRKNWSKARVLEYGQRLVTTPVDSMYKEAEIEVSCSKA